MFSQKYSTEKDVTKEENEESEDEIGGLFKKVSKEQQKLIMHKDNLNLTDSSLMMPWSNSSEENWLEPKVCFKTH